MGFIVFVKCIGAGIVGGIAGNSLGSYVGEYIVNPRHLLKWAGVSSFGGRGPTVYYGPNWEPINVGELIYRCKGGAVGGVLGATIFTFLVTKRIYLNQSTTNACVKLITKPKSE